MQYFFGSDTYAARQAITALAKKQKAAVRHIYGDDLQAQSINQVLAQGVGLFGTKLTVVHNPSTLPKATQEQLVTLLEEQSLDYCVLWDQTAPDKRSKLWHQVKKIATEFKTLPVPQLITWLQQEAVARKSMIEPAAATELIKRSGPDRWQLLSTLERLALPSSAITLAAVRKHVMANNQAEIFSTLDALVAGDTAKAIHNVELLLESGENEFYIFSMLAYQFRTLMMIKIGQEAGLSSGEIATQGKLHPYAVEKNSALVKKFSRAELVQALTKIMASDFAIKQGKVDARTALLMLVMGLVKQQGRQGK